MLVKLTVRRPAATVSLYCPNRLESSKAVAKLAHFLCHLSAGGHLLLNSVTLKENVDFNRDLLHGIFSALQLPSKQRLRTVELHASGQEIRHFLGGRSLATTVTECRFHNVRVDEHLLKLIVSGKEVCRERLEVSLLHQTRRLRRVIEVGI